ncbi:hypothetical protein [Kitasatospora sp. NPDC090308]|uniref:hypothetical protein n=1 Tax=Kitasatospora sp. NPDC090308 TaxID=3364082 RepID=UPI00382B2DBA
MLVVFAHLCATTASAPSESAGPLVEDLIWAHARPSEGIEHLAVRLAAHGLELYFFMRPDPERAARERVQALLDRVHGTFSHHGFALDQR